MLSTVQGGILRGHKSTPVRHKHMLSPPACSSPLIIEDLPGQATGRARPNVYVCLSAAHPIIYCVCTFWAREPPMCVLSLWSPYFSKFIKYLPSPSPTPQSMSGVHGTKASHSGHSWSSETVGKVQGVTKRCRLSLLTNSAALVYESKSGGGGGSCGVSANEWSCAHHVTWSPNKLWRSTSIFNLWYNPKL